MADPDAKGTPPPPPHLRVADQEDRECGTCKFFERGKCSKYAYLPVDGEWVCDSWAKGSGTDDDEPDSDEVTIPRDRQPQNMRDATVRVREHLRSKRRNSAY